MRMRARTLIAISTGILMLTGSALVATGIVVGTSASTTPANTKVITASNLLDTDVASPNQRVYEMNLGGRR
jgi:hypothetical protein